MWIDQIQQLTASKGILSIFGHGVGLVQNDQLERFLVEDHLGGSKWLNWTSDDANATIVGCVQLYKQIIIKIRWKHSKHQESIPPKPSTAFLSRWTACEHRPRLSMSCRCLAAHRTANEVNDLHWWTCQLQINNISKRLQTISTYLFEWYPCGRPARPNVWVDTFRS